jgi:hypothetical protein
MILDNLLMFTGTSNGASAGITSTANTDAPSAQTTTAASNILDLGLAGLPTYANGGGARDIGVGDDPSLKLLARVIVPFTSGGAATLQLQLQGAPDNLSGAPGAYVTMWTSAAYTLAQVAIAGARLANVDVPRPVVAQPLPRFLKLNFIVGATTFTGGTIEACIVIDRDDQIIGTTGAFSGYPAGINIAN